MEPDVTPSGIKPRAERRKQSTPAVRSCVGCRESFAQNSLLRLVLAPDGGTVCLDYLGKLPGRGTYVCANVKCLKRAVERGGFKRSFQQNVAADYDAIIKEASLASSRQLRSLLSLAFRAGMLAAGHSRVEHQLRQLQGALLLLAEDASSGVRRKFRLWAERNHVPVYEVLSKAELGAAMGVHETSLALVLGRGFAQKIEQEVQRAAQLFSAQEGLGPSS